MWCQVIENGSVLLSSCIWGFNALKCVQECTLTRCFCWIHRHSYVYLYFYQKVPDVSIGMKLQHSSFCIWSAAAVFLLFYLFVRLSACSWRLTDRSCFDVYWSASICSVDITHCAAVCASVRYSSCRLTIYILELLTWFVHFAQTRLDNCCITYCRLLLLLTSGAVDEVLLQQLTVWLIGVIKYQAVMFTSGANSDSVFALLSFRCCGYSSVVVGACRIQIY